jgi:uncharacterized membrane protein
MTTGHGKAKEKEPLTKQTQQECEQLAKSCWCQVLTHIDHLKKPSLKNGLKKCCAKVERLEQKIEKELHGLNISAIANEIFHMNASAIDQCYQVIDNVTGEIDEFVSSCDADSTDFVVPDGVSQLMRGNINHEVLQMKFAQMGGIVDDLEAKQRSQMQAIGFRLMGVGLVALLAFTVAVFRRRSSSWNEVSSAADVQEFTRQRLVMQNTAANDCESAIE